MKKLLLILNFLCAASPTMLSSNTNVFHYIAHPDMSAKAELQRGCALLPHILFMYGSLLYPAAPLAYHDNFKRLNRNASFKQLLLPRASLFTIPLPMALTIACARSIQLKKHWLRYVPGTLFTGATTAFTGYMAKKMYDAYHEEDALKFDTHLLGALAGLGATAFFGYGIYALSIPDLFKIETRTVRY